MFFYWKTTRKNVCVFIASNYDVNWVLERKQKYKIIEKKEKNNEQKQKHKAETMFFCFSIFFLQFYAFFLKKKYGKISQLKYKSVEASMMQ